MNCFMYTKMKNQLYAVNLIEEKWGDYAAGYRDEDNSKCIACKWTKLFDSNNKQYVSKNPCERCDRNPYCHINAERGAVKPHHAQHYPGVGMIYSPLYDPYMDIDANSLYPSAMVATSLYYDEPDYFEGTLDEIESNRWYAPFLFVEDMWQTMPNIFPIVPVRVTAHMSEMTRFRPDKQQVLLMPGMLIYPNRRLFNHVIDSVTLPEAYKAGWRWDETVPLRGHVIKKASTGVQELVKKMYADRNHYKAQMKTAPSGEKQRLDNLQSVLKNVMFKGFCRFDQVCRLFFRSRLSQDS